ncbi:restriction endonuclease subunit S [Mesomycoplasma ovipneumoniae]|uniref:restriction endonuclease subunit S n=1 Tax=Mesomycoplasma ovipneumoniae TaxID=29562 RepID=UPI00083E740F|nr:restriction endonuclease subunit S [Mesomycoplasma ovipneumoniae]
MNRYEEYKKVNLIWLKEIPSHWEIIPISHVFEERRERNNNGNNQFILSVMKNIGVIPYTDKGNVGNKASENIENYKVVYPNDLVLNSMNMMIGSLGKSNYKGVLSQVYYVLKLMNSSKYNIDYLNYLFKNKVFHESFRVLGKGILDHRLRVPIQLLKYEKIIIPPINEQEQIANYLDWKINEIDRLIQIEKEKIKELNHIKQLSISFEYKKISKKIRLKMLLSEPLLYGINGTGETDGSIRFIRITDINKDGELKENNCQYFDNCESKFLLKKGDILFARSGTVGKSYIHKSENMKMCFAGYLIRARLDTEIVIPEFVYLYTQSADYEKWKESISIQSTIQNISAEKYANLQIPFVDKIEQKNIIQHLRKIINSIEKCKVIISKKIKELELLKQSLISEVVTGKIDVRNVVIPEYEKVTVLDDEVEEFDEMDGIEDGN